MMKNLKIRKGEKKDITSLYKLIKELAIYEKSENKLIISQDSLFNDCFKENQAIILLSVSSTMKLLELQCITLDIRVGRERFYI